jgi:hypothetical protein
LRKIWYKNPDVEECRSPSKNSLYFVEFIAAPAISAPLQPFLPFLEEAPPEEPV